MVSDSANEMAKITSIIERLRSDDVATRFEAIGATRFELESLWSQIDLLRSQRDRYRERLAKTERWFDGAEGYHAD